jgi:uncharacterized membrane protein
MKKTLILFLLLTVAIGACKKDSSNSANFKYEINNIQDLTIHAGDTAYMNLEVKLLEGTPDDVNLLIKGLPPDVTASLSSGGSVPDFNTVVTFIANKNVLTGIFPLKIVAASLMGKQTYNFKLTVLNGSDTTGDTTNHDPFTYTVNGIGDVNVHTGNSASKDLEVKLLTGTAENVSLALTGLPAGLTSSFTHSSGLPTYTTSLNVEAGATATPGTYPVTLKATSSAGTQNYNFNVVVSTTTNQFDYTVNGINDLTVQQGGNGNLPLSVSLLSGTAENVSLSLTGLPAGASSSFSPASGLPSFNTTLNVTTTNAVAAGTYPLSLKSTSSAGTKTFGFNLIVTGNNGGDCAQGVAGNYTSMDSCTATAGTPVITKTGTNQIKITGLVGFQTYTVDVNGTVNCNNHTVNIPSQGIPTIPIPGATISGTGTFTDNTMTIHYTISVLTYTQSCRVDLSR